MSDVIKILGKLSAGRADGVLLDDVSVRGGYKVVQTIAERDAIPVAIAKTGTPAYVSDEKKTYRWSGTTWEEETTGSSGGATDMERITEAQIDAMFE